jgi:ribosomal protein S6--L-glutamate ligase
MKIAILSREPRSYSTKRLVAAAKERGHTPRVLDTLGFAMMLESENPDIAYKGRRLPAFDAVIPRIGASITYFGTAVVRQFEQMDVFCANTAAGIVNSRDKLRSLQILSRHDIGLPATEFVRSSGEILPAVDRLGGAPVIVKVLEGTQGKGVMLAESAKVAEAIFETLSSAKVNVLIQRYVAESKGTDVRAIVVGDEVIAAMKRRGAPGEFRSNVHKGGRAESFELNDEFRRTAIRAAQVTGLRVAGVDMLESNDGPQVMEVNSSPGLQGIEGATKVDVAGAIIDYVEKRVAFPDIDVRQRLTVSKGWGVSEVQVAKKKSSLAGRTLSQAGLTGEEINVLTLSRDGMVRPNPGANTVIKRGDKLLCFGRLEAMRGLMLPARSRRRSSKKKKAASTKR